MAVSGYPIYIPFIFLKLMRIPNFINVLVKIEKINPICIAINKYSTQFVISCMKADSFMFYWARVNDTVNINRKYIQL